MRFLSFFTLVLSFSVPSFVYGFDELWNKEKTCACEKIEILCVGDREIRESCGVNSRACSMNNSPMYGKAACIMLVNSKDCEFLGLDPGQVYGPHAPQTFDPGNCGLIAIDPKGNPERNLIEANSCCMLKHELGHSMDKVCHDKSPNPLCLETKTYDTSYTCLADVSKQFCKLHGNKPAYSAMCGRICEEAISFKALQLKATCECNNSTNGGNQNCILKCQKRS